MQRLFLLLLPLVRVVWVVGLLRLSYWAFAEWLIPPPYSGEQQLLRLAVSLGALLIALGCTVWWWFKS